MKSVTALCSHEDDSSDDPPWGSWRRDGAIRCGDGSCKLVHGDDDSDDDWGSWREDGYGDSEEVIKLQKDKPMEADEDGSMLLDKVKPMDGELLTPVDVATMSSLEEVGDGGRGSYLLMAGHSSTFQTIAFSLTTLLLAFRNHIWSL